MPVFKKITKFLNRLRRKKREEVKPQFDAKEHVVKWEKHAQEEDENNGNDDGRYSDARRSTKQRRSSFRSVPDKPEAPKSDSSYDSTLMYRTIGWEAKKCLTKGYDIGAWHLDCTTTSNNWLNIFSFGDGEPKMRGVTGGVGVRETFGKFELSQSWQTDGWIATIGASSETAYGLISSLFKFAYVNDDYMPVQAELDVCVEKHPLKFFATLPIKKPIQAVDAYAVYKLTSSFLLGFHGVFDCEITEFDKHILSVGYNDQTTEYSLKLKNFESVRGSLFRRIGRSWAVALKAKIYGEDAKTFSVGCQYAIRHGLIKARIRNDGIIGILFKHNMAKGIESMYHFGFNSKSPFDGNIKLGISWSISG